MHIQDINIKSRVYNYYFGNLVKAKKLETKNTLIDKKKLEKFGDLFYKIFSQ